MKVLGITFFFLAVIYIETKDSIKNKEWKELIVYSALMLIGMYYTYGIIFNFNLPNPSIFIIKYLEPVYNYIFKILLA